jgi:uncharacterized membrane-anchored protein YitT (DUF2179 family)
MNAFKKYWPSIRDFGLITLGTLLQALALRLFLVPANLASGGVSGISQIINYFTGWPIGLLVLIGNIPLFALGWRFLGGRRFAVRTAYAVVTYSIFVDLLPRLPFFPVNGLTDDLVINALYGAVISGVGYGLVYRGYGTSGGSDILARILNHWRGIPMTQSYLMVDSAVILAAGFVFGWKQALYALIALYVSGLVVDTTMEGGGTVRAAMIITSQPEIVSEKILVDMERGVTVLEGTGAYTGQGRPVLYCVVTRSEIQQLKSIVHEADPKAFMVIGIAHEALGEGFQPFRRQ